MPTPDPSHPPYLIVFIFKSIYCNYHGFKHKLHIKSWISRLSKKAQTRQVAQITQQKPFFNTISPSCFSFQCPKVLTNHSKESNYLQVNQVQAGTSDYKSHPNCILVCTASVWMTRWVFTSKSTWV